MNASQQREEKQTVSVYLPTWLKDACEQKARRNFRSFSKEVERALHEDLRRESLAGIPASH